MISRSEAANLRAPSGGDLVFLTESWPFSFGDFGETFDVAYSFFYVEGKRPRATKI